MFLSDFQSVDPKYRVPQAEALSWLGDAHARHLPDQTLARERIEKLLRRYGCSPERIEARGSFLEDFSHREWDRMQVFQGETASIDARMAIYKEVLNRETAKLYANREADFKNWIHVSCTGYVSPSPVQRTVSALGWPVEVLHAYHMGCYAALPALRMARGNLDAEILHTELCTLHFDAQNHAPEQLVIQSLFADGMIRYRASERAPSEGYEILGLREVVAPNSLEHMTWDVSAGGFQMTLSREVPAAVEAHIGDIIAPWRKAGTLFAIHPGGPRIIDSVKEALGLSEEQVHFSRSVLRCHGNMSSATLPHVWRDMLGEIPSGTEVISMAFGPGLTLSTACMKKV